MTMQGDLALKHANGMSFADVLALHAHLLAEVIREAAQGDPVTGLCPKVSTAKGAARLIDPEVSDR
jgi:hypothetical protein